MKMSSNSMPGEHSGQCCWPLFGGVLVLKAEAPASVIRLQLLN